MRVSIVGAGMGSAEGLSVRASRLIAEADLVVGAPRLVALAGGGHPGRVMALTAAADVVDALLEAHARVPEGSAVVLMSGDVGFHSGATPLLRRLRAHPELTVQLVCGTSSLQELCARAGVPWSGAHVVSAHGRRANAAGAVAAHGLTFFLTGGEMKAHDVLSQVRDAGWGLCEAWAASCMGGGDERLRHGTVAELAGARYPDLTVVLVRNEAPIARSFQAPGIPDERFERGGVPMTKMEVRTLVVSQLRLRSDAVVWDVGAGTGSVSVECGLAAPEGRVFAVERGEEGAGLIERNARALGAANVEVVRGCAPEALAGLPAPDAVFVGGSGGQLGAIVRAALDANPDARLVITAISLETLAEAQRVLADAAPGEPSIACVSVARARKAGGSHLMCALNPVYLIAAGGER
ncbi:precorrin-6Y C5,15-methyltransferase (decarboxylating) subunit CbiT [Berryella wangjianweii]|uniref:Precorrin-6Y C5,15-methyltransferase (Decarboxylating) subunit CbiT n=1 Tax=Berryella wangjianweii TaxID=2734634 RepID=A0A6M8IW48_9ACTN|nr:precorrin-6Y C5,15-methyltransferase (decarboxylating) subunit CbiT [Berryella wangjianweii]QKF06875.1 precorrin-6Y C5,15-methyltransferase (decarboxylating) subunit CbiT [Berryella wangjianweii]